MKGKYLILVFIGLLAWGVINAQTNPAAQTLPYSQDFSALAHSSTTYPDGWQGWTISTAPGSTFNTSAPTADRTLFASSTANTTSGNVHNYNGKIGYLNTASLDLTVVLAITTSGKTDVQVTYDVMTIRNPYDGSSNTRINEVTLQYRVGTTGAFTNLTGIEYQNNTTTQTGTVTTPQNLQTKNITLPSACNDQAVVQIRWASRQVSGVGSRPSFAVDNISVTGTTVVIVPVITVIPGVLTGLTYAVGSGPSAEQSFSVSGSNLTADIVVSAPAAYEVSTTSGGGFGASVNLVPSGGSVPSTPVYIRLKAGLASNIYNQTVNITSTGADAKTVTCKGYVSTLPSANLLLEENFGYDAGALLTDVGWTAHSSAGTNSLITASPGLTYPAYPSVSGNCATMLGNGEDVHRTFTAQTTGSVYCSFLINVSNTTAAGDYIFHFGPSPIGTDYKGRLFVGRDDSNNVRFGLTKSATVGTAVQWTGYNYAYNTTYLVVLKYTIIGDAANDQVCAWINPAFSGPEPAPMLTAVSSETDIGTTGVASVAIRQCHADIVAKFDGIRVATTWYYLFNQDVVPPGVTTTIGSVDVDAAILLYYDDTLLITDVPYLPNAGSLVNPIIILFTAPAGTTDLVFTVGAGTWYGVAYYGGGWQTGTPFPRYGPGTITFSAVPFDSKGEVPVVLSEGNDPTLPVELSSFTVSLTQNLFVNLSWTTVTETDMLGFYILRSEDNALTNAQRINDVVIPATNTSQQHTYRFTDCDVSVNHIYYYWLEVVDIDGSTGHFGPQGILVSGGTPPPPDFPTVSEITKSAYPNPFRLNANLTIQANITKGETGVMTVYNLRGQVVRTFKLSEGYNRIISWDGKDEAGIACSSGLYFYKLTTPSCNSIRKLIILK